ncbi:FAD binding domain-containing protein [Bradyrhizobium sp. LjRoot220]|uniref:FAD binding domain-containing protein n=1 Tax=Bradyrhizobium sp. LjRoot220 TaxID=3342284 RepID=UPI003ECD3483
MKPASFDFFAPRSLDNVLALLGNHGEDCRILAGGQSLVPLLNLRMLQPAVLISINDCTELSYIRESSTAIVCGALTRQIEVEQSELVQREVPLLAKAARLIGGMANRNRGTVCGSLAHADPLAELPAVALALDATFVVNGQSGRRDVAAADFFVSELSTCIEPGEMLEAVRFPKRSAGERAAFLELGNRRHGFAVAGLAVQLNFDDDKTCIGARIAALGAGAVALRLRNVEETLEGKKLGPEIIAEAAEMAYRDVDPPSDIHADAAHRKHLARTLLSRAVNEIIADEGGGRP